MKSDSVTKIHYGFTLEQAFTQILITKKLFYIISLTIWLCQESFLYQIIKSGMEECFALKLLTNNTFYSKLRIF